MRKFYLFCSLCCFSVTLLAQKAVISGIVTDEKDKSSMIGVNIRLKGTTEGASTDLDGKYSLNVPAGKSFSLEVTYTGYQARTLDFLPLKENEQKVSNIQMSEMSKDLDIVVVTGSKFEKKLGEQIVSLEVLKGQNITQSSQSLNEAVNKVPGVNMMGKTISIRGGSGFADATSNRVMFMLDDIPMVSPENGGINWFGMPIEAINQMEIVKGASNATAGASALNGLINIRTISPSIDKPFNKLYVSYGLYDHHKNRDFYWFLRKTDKNGKERYQPPMFGGISFVHSSKINNVDLTLNLAYNGNQGYMINQSSNRIRGFWKVKYSPSKMPNLAVGVAGNVFSENSDDFFMYEDYHKTPSIYDSIMTGDSLTLMNSKYANKVFAVTVNVLPYFTYYDKHNNRHAVKMGIYHNLSYNTAGDSSTVTKVWGEYSFSKQFEKIDLNLMAGVSGYYTKTPGNSMGERFEANAAAFLQVEKKFFKRLTLMGGVRLEYNQLDNTNPNNEQWVLNQIFKRDSSNLIKSPVQPVFRLGANFQAAEATYLRVSFGQGYRYPSIAEKYVQTGRTGIYVVPNFDLKPESGWSAEIGIKQGVKISKWVFYADLAAFVNRYRNMINFEPVSVTNLPVEIPPKYKGWIYSQAVNTEKAIIYGAEASAIGTGNIFGVPLNFLVGYTFMNPLNENYKEGVDVPEDKYLMFRIKHSGKADIQAEPKNIIIGITGTLTSQVENIGNYRKMNVIRRWRENHKDVDFVFDARLGYNWKDRISATAIVKNILNREYVQRPGFVEAPRNYTLLITYSF